MPRLHGEAELSFEIGMGLLQWGLGILVAPTRKHTEAPWKGRNRGETFPVPPVQYTLSNGDRLYMILALILSQTYGSEVGWGT